MVAPTKKAWQTFTDTIISRADLSHLENVSSSVQKTNNPTDTFSYCYKNEIPSFVEAEIERLYGTIFSSLKKLSITGNTSNASTYVAVKDSRITTIFLYRQIKNQIQVLNQVLNLQEGDIECFASYMFKTFKDVHAISFVAVYATVQRMSFPFQQFNQIENIIVSLPSSTNEYWSSLGKSTRHNLNYYRNKLKREFPSFSFTLYENDAITATQIRTVLNLSKVRIKEKGKTFGIDEQEEEHLILLAKTAGLVGLIEIDGKICAGSICYRAGENFCLEVIAHDPAFNEYRLGTLCCYLTISECIARGAKEFHFLWGEYDYKYRFLGKQRKLDNIAVYRSHWHMIKNWRLALRMMFDGAVRNAKLWKNNPERKKGAIELIGLQALAWTKKIKIKAEKIDSSNALP